MTEIAAIKRQIIWLVKQVQCIKSGACVSCGEGDGTGSSAVTLVETVADLNEISSPQLFQRVSVKSNGHLYVYLSNSTWHRQGEAFVISNDSIINNRFVNVPKERISLLYQGGDAMLLPGTTKVLNSGTIGLNGLGLDGLTVLIYIV